MSCHRLTHRLRKFFITIFVFFGGFRDEYDNSTTKPLKLNLCCMLINLIDCKNPCYLSRSFSVDFMTLHDTPIPSLKKATRKRRLRKRRKVRKLTKMRFQAYFNTRDKAGYPEYLACTGSQSQYGIWFILPARGAIHIINANNVAVLNN